jgi:5-(carboxyamino)imidazole ribonucleotide mutase
MGSDQGHEARAAAAFGLAADGPAAGPGAAGGSEDTGARRGPLVGIVGGSRSDFPVLMDAQSVLEELGIPCELRVVSAHRTPDHLFRYAETAASRGIQVIIAGAGGAAHLPGMLAAKTTLPVIGVPIPTEHLRGLDSLLSIVQMPRGIPVATVAIGNATNAALLAAEIMALLDPALADRLAAVRAHQTETVLADPSNAEPLG